MSGEREPAAVELLLAELLKRQPAGARAAKTGDTGHVAWRPAVLRTPVERWVSHQLGLARRVRTAPSAVVPSASWSNLACSASARQRDAVDLT